MLPSNKSIQSSNTQDTGLKGTTVSENTEVHLPEEAPPRVQQCNQHVGAQQQHAKPTPQPTQKQPKPKHLSQKHPDAAQQQHHPVAQQPPRVQHQVALQQRPQPTPKHLFKQHPVDPPRVQQSNQHRGAEQPKPTQKHSPLPVAQQQHTRVQPSNLHRGAQRPVAQQQQPPRVQQFNQHGGAQRQQPKPTPQHVSQHHPVAPPRVQQSNQHRGAEHEQQQPTRVQQSNQHRGAQDLQPTPKHTPKQLSKQHLVAQQQQPTRVQLSNQHRGAQHEQPQPTQMQRTPKQPTPKQQLTPKQLSQQQRAAPPRVQQSNRHEPQPTPKQPTPKQLSQHHPVAPPRVQQSNQHRGAEHEQPQPTLFRVDHHQQQSQQQRTLDNLSPQHDPEHHVAEHEQDLQYTGHGHGCEGEGQVVGVLSQHQRRKRRSHNIDDTRARRFKKKKLRRTNARLRRRQMIDDAVAIDMIEYGAPMESRAQLELLNGAIVDALASAMVDDLESGAIQAPSQYETHSVQAELMAWGLSLSNETGVLTSNETDVVVYGSLVESLDMELAANVKLRWLDSFEALTTCNAQGAVFWARHELSSQHELFQESEGQAVLVGEQESDIFTLDSLVEAKSFTLGEAQWGEYNVNALIVICMSVREDMCSSLELLRALVSCVPADMFASDIVPVMISHGWKWTLTAKFCPSDAEMWECALRRLGDIDDNMDAWLAGFTRSELGTLWAMVLNQQSKHSLACPTLELFVTILCTLREQDFQSLSKAQNSVLTLRQGGGIVANLADCAANCVYDIAGHGTCRDECVLRKSFENGMQKNTNLHVRALREVVKIVPGILSEEQAALFPRGYLRTRVTGACCEVHPLHAHNPSGQCIAPHALVLAQWVQVPGVDEVVFNKLLSLHRVGDWALCDEEIIIAVDSKIAGLVLLMPKGSTAEDFGDKVFGFDAAIPFASLAKRAKSHGLVHLRVVILAVAKGDHKRKVYRSNALRSRVSTHIQTHHVQGATQAFCLEFGYDYRNARHVDSFRESLRFLFDLYGLEKTIDVKRNRTDVDICIVTADGKYIPTHGMGPVYVPMDLMLEPDDLAYWWQHPGQLVRVQDADSFGPHIFASQSRVKVFTGSTRDQALKSAMMSCASVSDLITCIGDGSMAVCYWCMQAIGSTADKSSWDFLLSDVCSGPSNMGSSSVSSMLSGFYTLCGSDKAEKKAILARVKEILNDYDGDLSSLVETLCCTFTAAPYAALLTTKLAEVHDVMILEYGVTSDCTMQEERMSSLLARMYEVADPRMIFIVANRLAVGDTEWDRDQESLVKSVGQYSAEQPWVVLKGSPICWEYTKGSTWQKLHLGGAPRWQKAVTCVCGEGTSILTAYAMKNTPADESNLFASQRIHQHLHCDLPHPSVVRARTPLHVSRCVHVLLAPLGDERIALQVYDHTLQAEKTVWIEPGEFIVFAADSCWHAGYGGKQGDRLYVTFVVGELAPGMKECVLEDELDVLWWADIEGTPSPYPSNWRAKASCKQVSKRKRACKINLNK